MDTSVRTFAHSCCLQVVGTQVVSFKLELLGELSLFALLLPLFTWTNLLVGVGMLHGKEEGKGRRIGEELL